MIKENFKYNDINKFVYLYGVTSKQTSFTVNEYGQKNKVKSKSAPKQPGISPLVFTNFLLNNTIFITLEQMAEGLPPYEEKVISIDMDMELKEAYEDLKHEANQYLNSNEKNKMAVMSQFANLLLTYQDTPYNDLSVIDNRLDKLIYTTKKLDKIRRNKEIKLLELIEEKRFNNEKILIYYESVNKTDLGKYIYDLLTEEGFNAYLLKSSDAKAKDRSNFIDNLVTKGVDIIITNPSLVKTGLNLIDFTTLIFYQTGYNLSTLRQASRRSWRLSQKNPVTVYFMYYKDTAQESVLEIMSEKLIAAKSLEGDVTSEGLNSVGCNMNMLMQIANNVCNNIKNTIDKSVFKSFKHIKEVSNHSREHIYGLNDIVNEYNENGKYNHDLLEKDKCNYILDDKILKNTIKYFD